MRVVRVVACVLLATIAVVWHRLNLDVLSIHTKQRLNRFYDTGDLQLIDVVWNNDSDRLTIIV